MKYLISKKEKKETATHRYVVWLCALLLSLAMPFFAFSQEINSEKATSCDTIASSGFDPNKPAVNAGFTVRFMQGEGKYAFDAGREPLFGEQTTTFSNSNYVTAELLEDIITYRRFGGRAKVGGSFVSTVEKLSRDELALVKQFNNSMRFEAKIRIPKGEKINIAKVGPWPIEAPEFMGGADQIILRYGYPQHIWVQSIKDLKTGKIYSYGDFHVAFPDLCLRK